jgi:hypothetical protein
MECGPVAGIMEGWKNGIRHKGKRLSRKHEIRKTRRKKKKISPPARGLARDTESTEKEGR